MQDEKKVYGFTLSLYEYIETIPTLWAAVKGVYIHWSPDAHPQADFQNLSKHTQSMWPKIMP